MDSNNVKSHLRGGKKYAQRKKNKQERERGGGQYVKQKLMTTKS